MLKKKLLSKSLDKNNVLIDAIMMLTRRSFDGRIDEE